jgi:two-component system CheB/CheR fusion protein
VETVNDDAAAKQIEIKIDAGEDLVFVNADPLRLEQVIWNLLNNAVKFTPVGGTVTIRLRREHERASVNIEDTGYGIEPEFLPHVFEMFRQADASSSRPHGGMGIGLALVQQLVGLHGGTVAVESTLGHGSRFTIELPATGERESRLTHSPSPEVGVLNQMRILIVDDSADTVDMLRRLFEMDGASVTTAGSAADALGLAGEHNFDVVLSDISMPGMDGFEFIRRFRELARQKDVPVLALTGFGRAEDVERAQSEGFCSLVTKPIDVNNLVQMLRQLRKQDGQSAAGAAD